MGAHPEHSGAFEVLAVVASTEPVAATLAIVALGVLSYLTWSSRSSTKALQEMSESHLSHMRDVSRSSIQVCDRIDDLAKELRAAVGKTWLTKDQCIRVVSDAMWREADKQLQYLEAILLNNHIDRPERRRFLEANIISKFLEFSEGVKDNLNEFQSGIGQLGDFVYSSRSFNRQKFNAEMFEIFFRPQCEDGNQKEIDIQIKMKDLAGLLRTVHYEVTESIRAECKSQISRRETDHVIPN